MSLGDFIYEIAVSRFGGWVIFGSIGFFLSVLSVKFFRRLRKKD